jgi:hypothetical protein
MPGSPGRQRIVRAAAVLCALAAGPAALAVGGARDSRHPGHGGQEDANALYVDLAEVRQTEVLEAGHLEVLVEARHSGT